MRIPIVLLARPHPTINNLLCLTVYGRSVGRFFGWNMDFRLKWHVYSLHIVHIPQECERRHEHHQSWPVKFCSGVVCWVI
jgi:hypothetical protein